MAGTLGSGSELNMRLGTSGTYTSLLEPGVGCDTVAVNLDRDSRVVPGGGNYEITEVIDQVEGVVSFTVDENDTTRPLFWGKGLRRFGFEWTPNGGTQVSGKLWRRLCTRMRSVGLAGSLSHWPSTETPPRCSRMTWPLRLRRL